MKKGGLHIYIFILTFQREIAKHPSLYELKDVSILSENTKSLMTKEN